MSCVDQVSFPANNWIFSSNFSSWGLWRRQQLAPSWMLYERYCLRTDSKTSWYKWEIWSKYNLHLDSTAHSRNARYCLIGSNIEKPQSCRGASSPDSFPVKFSSNFYKYCVLVVITCLGYFIAWPWYGINPYVSTLSVPSFVPPIWWHIYCSIPKPRELSFKHAVKFGCLKVSDRQTTTTYL